MKSKKEKIVKKSTKVVSSNKSSFPLTELVKDSDVLQIIRYLKVRKAPGSDKISNSVIKNLPRSFISFLTHVFNSCFQRFYFPKRWKIGKIIAIPKPGKDQSVPTNYRPISLLSCIGKIYEKLILDKLLEQEENFKIFIPQQFGFRNGHSTV
jgi:hypothetical protein